MTNTHPVRRRKAVNVSLDEALVAEARDLGINLSRACEEGLVHAAKAERWRQWQEENREAIESSNAYVAKNGVPFAEYRMF